VEEGTVDDRDKGLRTGDGTEAAHPVVPGNVGSLDDVPMDDAPAVGGTGDVAALEARVDRLERQLAEMVKRFAERLNDHERRLDRVDEPPERSWLKR
jgi:hypothetical protein